MQWKKQWQKDPKGRRKFIKQAGIGAVTIFAGQTLGITYAIAKTIPVPSAIKADPDPKIASIWSIRANGFSDTYCNLSTKETILAMMKLINKETANGQVSLITQKTSHAYYLLCAQLNNLGTSFEKKFYFDNISLIHFTNGLGKLYSRKNRNKEARRFFAHGIFSAAHLSENDFERLNKVGIETQYNGNIYVSAELLAEEFLNANLQKKETILNIGIWEKFKNTKPNFELSKIDINSMAYQMKSMYWNLGFYMISETLLKLPIRPLIKKETSLYRQTAQAMKYNTASKKLSNLFV